MGKKSRSKATHARKPPPPPVDPLDAVHAAATTPAWLVATRDDAVAVKLLETLERAVAKLPRTSPPIPGPTDDARGSTPGRRTTAARASTSSSTASRTARRASSPHQI